MPQLDVVDETWIGAPPARVAAVVADGRNWRQWWPDLDLVVDELRGVEGVRWLVRPSRAGAGSMEVWLEPDLDGTRVHYFLRLDAGRRLTPRRAQRAALAHRARAKQIFWALGDALDAGATRRR